MAGLRKGQPCRDRGAPDERTLTGRGVAAMLPRMSARTISSSMLAAVRAHVIRAVVLTVALALAGSILAMTAAAASPAPSAGGAASPAPASRSLTGHWAIARTSGIDLVQKGSALTGTSAMGVSLNGTVVGDQVTFRWWRGVSYAAAKKADRGNGVMQLSADGERLRIAARDEEAGPGPFPTQYDAVRVHDIVTGPSPTPWTWYYGQDWPTVYSLSRTVLDFTVESWVWCIQTGYWPSASVIWTKLEDSYTRQGILVPGGWSANGNGPNLLIPGLKP
jgi:hypothetical protein